MDKIDFLLSLKFLNLLSFSISRVFNYASGWHQYFYLSSVFETLGLFYLHFCI